MITSHLCDKPNVSDTLGYHLTTFWCHLLSWKDLVIEVEFVCYSCRHGGLSVGDKILAVNDRVSPTFSNIWLLVSGCFLLWIWNSFYCILNSQFINPVDKTKLLCNTPHQCSTTVSLETYPLYSFVIVYPHSHHSPFHKSSANSLDTYM